MRLAWHGYTGHGVEDQESLLFQIDDFKMASNKQIKALSSLAISITKKQFKRVVFLEQRLPWKELESFNEESVVFWA